MQDIAFEHWLKHVDMRPLPQVRDNLSRVRRVEKLGVNFDRGYDENRCNGVLAIVGNDCCATGSFILRNNVASWHLPCPDVYLRFQSHFIVQARGHQNTPVSFFALPRHDMGRFG